MANEPTNKPATAAPAGAAKPAEPVKTTTTPEVQSTAVGGFGKTVTTTKDTEQPTSEDVGHKSSANMPVGGNAPALDQRDQATACLPGDQGLANKPGMSAH